MTDASHSPTPPPGPPHDGETETHAEPDHATVDDHDAHDAHGHTVEPLGPIDLRAWGAGALGLAVAAATALCFALATAPIG